MNYTQVCSDYARYTVASQQTYCVHTLVPTQLKNVTLFFRKQFPTVAKSKTISEKQAVFLLQTWSLERPPTFENRFFVAVTLLSFRPTQLILIRLSQPIGIEITFGRFVLSRAFTLNFNFKKRTKCCVQYANTNKRTGEQVRVCIYRTCKNFFQNTFEQ